MPHPRDIHFHTLASWVQVIEFLSQLQHKCALYHWPFQSRNIAFSLAQPGQEEPASFGDDSSFHRLYYLHNHSSKWTLGGFCLSYLLCIFSDGILKINNKKFQSQGILGVGSAIEMGQISQGQWVEWQLPGAGSTGELVFNGYRVSVGEDEKVLEMVVVMVAQYT